MSSKLNNIQKLQNQIKSLKGQLKSRNSFQTNAIRGTSAPVSKNTSWSSTSKPLRVRQSERIATITASSNAGEYAVDKFVINPADENTFPWLSSIAQLFDKYKFHELRFRFINYVSTVTNGNVSMAVDFDTLDPTPQDSVEMSNLAKFVTFSPWKVEELSIPVNRRGNRPWYYCYDSNAESNTNVDLKTYNIGNFFVSTEGLSASQVVGYIVADYDVEFLDKNPPSVTDSVLDTDFAISASTSGGSTLDEQSGLEVTYTSNTYTINNVVVGEQYSLLYYATSSNNATLSKTGYTGASGEYVDYDVSSTLHYCCGIITASATSITLALSGAASSRYLSIAKI
jgi:hypothetical protein